MAKVYYDGGGTKQNPLDALSLATTDDERYNILTSGFGFSPEQARENITAFGKMSAPKTATNTSSNWIGTPTQDAGARANSQKLGADVFNFGLAKGSINPSIVASNAQKYGVDLSKSFGNNAVTGVFAPTATTESKVKPLVSLASSSVAPSASVNPIPALKEFNFTPSRSTDPNEARRLAGLRAWMQVKPQIDAQNNRKALALQGLDMLKQRLQQGVTFTRDATLKEMPTLVDQQRRLRASQGLSESGFLNADQTAIQEDALQTIAQRASEASLAEQQAAERVGAENRMTDEEIANLLGQVSMDARGSFTGSLVDTMSQDIIDKNEEFNMRARQIAFAENRAQNELDLARWNAQDATRRGDAQLAAQYAQMAQQKEISLANLQQDKDQFAFDKQKFEAGAPFRQAELDRVQQEISQANELFPMKKSAAQLTNDMAVLEKKSAQLKYDMELLDQTILNDPDIGKRATAIMAKRQKEAELEQINAQTEYARKQAADAGKREPKPADYTSTLGPLANTLIHQAEEAEQNGDTERADELRSQAMDAARDWKRGTSSSNPDSASNTAWKSVMDELTPFMDPVKSAGLTRPQRVAAAKAVVSRWARQLSEEDQGTLVEFLKAQDLW